MAKHVVDEDASTQSDYDRIGGGRAVSAVVDNFYERVLGDPQLVSFFTGVDMSRLKRHQVLLISQALGGPAEYDGRELHSAHAELDISDDDFARVVDHLVAALQDAAVEPEIIGRVGEVLGATKDDIVGAGAR
jgi:hemoglobin